MFESIFPFKKLGNKIKSPKKKKKAMDFVTGGQAPGASIVSGARNNIVSFQRNNVSAPSQNNLGSVINNISNAQTYGRATGYDILDFFGSKKTERRLRKSVQRLRNSLAETFEIAKFLRISINRIAKQLKDIPSISGGGGGGGGALGLIAGLISGLIGGVLKLIGSVVGAVFSLFSRIGLGGAAKTLLPKIALGGLGVLGVLGLGSSFMNKVNAQEADFDIQRKEESQTTDTREKNTTTFEKIINKFKQAVDLLLSGGKANKNGQNQPVTPQQSLVPSGQTPAALSGSEEDLLKRLMIAEAGGEGEMGMALVARSVMNRAGLIQSGKTRAGTFNALSGSITDVIQASGQYQPYAQGKLNRELTPEENARATKALELARNQASMRGNLEAQGKSSAEINNLMGSTGFRNYNAGAGIDPSQQVNETQFGRHTFNTAGNANLISSQQVNFGNVPASQLSPEVSVIQMPDDSGGVQAAPSSAAPAIPSQTKGPSIAFLPSNNFDSYAGLSAKMLYNIVEA